MLMKNYPGLLITSKSFSDSETLGEQLHNKYMQSLTAPEGQEDAQNDNPDAQFNTAPAYLWWIKKVNATEDSPSRRSSNLEQQRRLQNSHLKDVRVHRHSLTYRSAMLNINRLIKILKNDLLSISISIYIMIFESFLRSRLRASSCPDIYRNTVATTDNKKHVWNSGLWEFWDVLVDMLDFSHFSNSKFLLFAISNFFLQLWYDVPYVYLTDNAIEMGFSETDASMLISIIGITNTGGEVSITS